MSSNKSQVTGGTAGRYGLLPELKSAARKRGCLSREVMEEIAGQTAIPINEVYGVASFYSYLPLSTCGENIIKVCGSLPCEMKDYQTVVACIKNEIGIGPGQTTPDGKFTLQVVSCIGACDLAPAMMINDTVYGNLTAAGIAGILKSY